jgi:uncharacterized protein (TIGR00297 family)
VITKELYLLWGGLGALVIAYAGYRFHALTKSGAIAAVIIGTMIFGFGGYVAAAALLYFFVTGSILSRLPQRTALIEKQARNWMQVISNGGPAALAVLLVYADPSYRESGTLFFFGALSAATADTWATEFGVRAGKRAYHVLTFQPIEAGLSGGISVIGTLASMIGAISFAAVAYVLLPGDDFLCGLFLVPIVPLIAAAGIIGSILDSLIGATLQAKYRTADGKIVERYLPGGQRISGFPLITNDVTNLLSTTWAGFIAVGITTF